MHPNQELDVRWNPGGGPGEGPAWGPRYMVYPSQQQQQPPHQPADHRTHPQTRAEAGSLGGHDASATGNAAAAEVEEPGGGGDELMFLFDVIRKKTERLKSDFEEIKMQVCAHC